MRIETILQKVIQLETHRQSLISINSENKIARGKKRGKTQNKEGTQFFKMM